MPDDMKFDEFLRRAAKDYNAPVPPAADAMWSRIEADVAEAIRPKVKNQFARRRTWIVVGAGIAATLMLGVAVGRWTASPTQTAVVQPMPAHQLTATDDSTRSAAHAEAVTIAHLADAEVFLTVVRSDLKTGRTDAERAARSRELLVRTRLLLGASADRSPAVDAVVGGSRAIAGGDRGAAERRSPSMDLKLLDETMREGNVLPRIRATLPAQSMGA